MHDLGKVFSGYRMFVTALILAAVGVAGYFVLRDTRPTINSYDECVAAGYPVAESYPEQCFTEDRRFVNEL